jgi:hypothetical protein
LKKADRLAKKKWASWVDDSKKLEGKPVIFIAINSGTSPSSVKSYANTAGLTWPVIADEDRSFEKAMGMKEIGFKDHNIWQLRVISPDGKVHGGDTNNLEKTISRFLNTASWKVDPADITEPLKPAWNDVEYGRVQEAIPKIKRYLNSRSEKTKLGAEKLNAAIESQLDNLIQLAKAAQSEDRKWDAYKHYTQASTTFKGLSKARKAYTAAREIAKDKALRDEITAYKTLQKAKSLLASPNRSARRSAMSILEAIAKRYPDTEAGATAKDLTASPEPEK